MSGHERFSTADATVREREKTLLGIAARLLDAPDLRASDNFFAAGGDASLALRLLLDSSSAGLHVSMDEVRGAACISDLARAARASDERGSASPSSGPIGLGLTPSWYLSGCGERVPYWNINTVVESTGVVAAGALESAMLAVAAQHEATRHRFWRDGAGWRAEVVDEPRVEVRRLSLGGLTPDEETQAVGVAVDDLQRAIDVENGPVAILAVLDRGRGRTPVVVLTATHLISDAYSQFVLVEDLEIAYGQVLHGETVRLPVRPTSLRRWTERLHELAWEPLTDLERAYWLGEERWRGAAPVPVDSPAGDQRHSSVAWLRARLDRASTAALLARGRRGGGGALSVFLAALGAAYRVWTDHDRMAYWLLLHGRESDLHGLDLRRTAGCVLHSFPMLQPLPANGPQAMLEAVRAMRSALPRNGIGYDLLRYLRSDPDLSQMPQPQIVVNYRGRLAAAGAGLFAHRLPRYSTVRYDPSAQRLVVLELDAVIERGELVMRWGYSRQLHEPASIERLAEAHVAELARYA